MDPCNSYGGTYTGGNAACVPAAGLPAPCVPQIQSPNYVNTINQTAGSAQGATNAALAGRGQQIRNAMIAQNYAAQAARQINSEGSKLAFLDNLDSQGIHYDPGFRALPWQQVRQAAANYASGVQLPTVQPIQPVPPGQAQGQAQPTAQPGQSGAPQAPGQANTPDLIRQAQAAVARGADKGAVWKRLNRMGLSDQDIRNARL
jgi:hypothetical protein